MSTQKPDEVRVEEIMSADVQMVSPQTTVKKAATLMAKTGHGCLLVVHRGLAVGIVTERDIVHKVTAEGVDPSKVQIGDVMSSPLVTISPSATIREAADRMIDFGIRRIVVTNDQGALVGLLTAGDLARWLAEQKGYSDPTLNAIARLKVTGTGGPYG